MNFYEEVAEKSPIPVVIYNFPAVCNGIDIDSDTMSTLHKKHKNIVGVKLTCASVGKITRLAAEFPSTEFAVFGGQSDFLLAGLAVGSAGAISGFANVCPKTMRKCYELWVGGKQAEALKMQRTAAFAEVIGKSGIANTKYGASLYSARQAGIEGSEEKLRPRRPYEPLSDAQKKSVYATIEETMKIEESL